jgi:hypothetical protein
VKKAMILMALTALLVALVAGGATAKGKGSGKGPKQQREITYVFEGNLTSVDPDAGTFTVAVEEGNKAARAYLGEQTFTTEEGYTKVEVDEVEGMDLADLVVGQRVSVQTKASTPESIFVARRVSAETAEVEEAVPST